MAHSADPSQPDHSTAGTGRSGSVELVVGASVAGAAPVAAQRDGLAHRDGEIAIADTPAIAAEILHFGLKGRIVPQARLTGVTQPCGHVGPGRPDARIGLHGALQCRGEIERGVLQSRLCQRGGREESAAGHACKPSARPVRPGRFV